MSILTGLLITVLVYFFLFLFSIIEKASHFFILIAVILAIIGIVLGCIVIF